MFVKNILFSLVTNIDRWPPFVWLSRKIFFQLSLVRDDDRWFPSRGPAGGLDDEDGYANYYDEYDNDDDDDEYDIDDD